MKAIRGRLGLAGPSPLRVLMVCTGNICRSPTAEGVLRAKLQRRAGTGASRSIRPARRVSHQGSPRPARQAHAAQRGYDLVR
jgi:protein-tyrosine phosphatase